MENYGTKTSVCSTKRPTRNMNRTVRSKIKLLNDFRDYNLIEANIKKLHVPIPVANVEFDETQVYGSLTEK